MSKVILSPFERVVLARDTNRPKIDEFIENLFEDFIEMKGDRLGYDDKAILGGIARFHGMPVTVIGHKKGRNMEENVACNFGMPRPQGFRKGMRLMKQAEKFGRPIITFIDTPGAYPGMDAEENGQSVAISESMALMSTLKVPVISVITGEGNSGGALAIAVANKVIMLENAVYSILSPEGFASILYKDASQSQSACEAMKMTARELYDFGLIDEVVDEPDGGLQASREEGFEALDKAIYQALAELVKLSGEELSEDRYNKFREFDKKLFGKEN